jgi:hypothetical protein
MIGRFFCGARVEHAGSVQSVKDEMLRPLSGNGLSGGVCGADCVLCAAVRSFRVTRRPKPLALMASHSRAVNVPNGIVK